MSKYIHIDDEFWDEIENGEVIILYHNGHEENIVVPNEIDGHTVTRISNIKPTEEAKTITIPKSVKVIEDDAFEGFPKDFVIYCYPTTEYSNKDGYKIVYLEDNEEVLQEEKTQEESSQEVTITEELPLSEQSTEEVVIVENDSVENNAIEETVSTPPIDEKPTTDNSNPFIGVAIGIVVILIGIVYVLKGKKC